MPIEDDVTRRLASHLGGSPWGTIGVRVDVEGLKQSIHVAINDRNDEIAKLIQLQVDAAIREFDFAGVIASTVKFEMEKQISEGLQRAIRQTMWNHDVVAALAEKVVKAIPTILRETR